nr:PREDICTED: hsp70-Hsp90 organizing protein 3-like [Bemisia tabaci]
MSSEEANNLKTLGNASIKEEKYAEAILHYSHAIKIDPNNYQLYSNRSLAFLKMQQYYSAMEDAEQTIVLKPDWAKGYFRKGEVQLATHLYTDALLSYRLALRLMPADLTIMEAISRTIKAEQKDKRADSQIPWLGAGIGIIIGVIIVISDQIATKKPTVTHPLLMALVTMAISLIGYGVGWMNRYYVKCNRDHLLDPPIDLLKEFKDQDNNDMNGEENSPEHRSSSHRSSKGRARQRYRKGKS